MESGRNATVFSSRPSLLVRQVCSLLDRDPIARLIVFVSRGQLGTALYHAVGRARGRAAGLQVTTVEQYAKTIAELPLLERGKNELTPGDRYFFCVDALQRLSSRERRILTNDRPLASITSALSRTFDTLRQHGVTPSIYRTQIGGSERKRIQAQVFETYEQLIDDHNRYDTATLLNGAQDEVENGAIDHSTTVVSIMDTVSLTSLEYVFLASLRRESRSPGLYRIGPLSSKRPRPTAPSSSAAVWFPDAPRPTPSDTHPSALGSLALTSEGPPAEEMSDTVRFWTSTGTRREVQAVFEDIVRQDRPLDTVEVAYTTPDPYLSLIDTMAERYDVPVSLSPGRAIDATRPGQALTGFFEWIASGCPVSDLILLLRSGLVQIDRPITVGDEVIEPLDSTRAASLLAEKRYPEQPSKYEKTFTAWIAELSSEITDLPELDENSWAEERHRTLRERKAAVETVSALLQELLELAHINDDKSVRPTQIAKSGRTFLQEYGPTPAPVGSEEEHTADEAARNHLIDRLQSLHTRDHLPALPLRRLANQMKQWLGLSPYIRAQYPRPGRAHVVPLESAGYANRDHLYVVGLDATSTTVRPPEDPLLGDPEREALSNENRSLPLRRERGDATDWRMRHALARHEGTFTLSASTYDLREGEDRFESPLFLQLKNAGFEKGEATTSRTQWEAHHHGLSPDPNRALSALDRWTRASAPSSEQVQDALRERYPWIRQGLDAVNARRSKIYTVYDGLLATGTYASLNPMTTEQAVSTAQLETYAQSPYTYFLRYVLDIEPREEPALDDVAWLDALGRGGVLHEVFHRFMAKIERRPQRSDESTLEGLFNDVLEETREEKPPPNKMILAATRRRLWNDALLFLRAEAARSDDDVPHKFEVGFGYPPHRREKTDYGTTPVVDLGPLSVPLRGRIDRVDQRSDGTISLWDYKTGSSRRYSETDLLGDPPHLQWALYAYALETLEDTDVYRAGYFFTNTDEMGKRIAASPAEHRDRVATLLQWIQDGVTAGAFPITDSDDLRYAFDSLFHNYAARRKQLSEKEWPQNRPASPPLRGE